MATSDKTDEAIAEETYAERERLVELLAGLTPEQWAAPSLCAGWRVRDVVAHITMAYRVGALRFLGGLARARFGGPFPTRSPSGPPG